MRFFCFNIFILSFTRKVEFAFKAHFYRKILVKLGAFF
jgi:hypothetical protein